MGKGLSELEEEFRALLRVKPLRKDQARKISETIEWFKRTYRSIYVAALTEMNGRRRGKQPSLEAKVPCCPECRYYGLIQLEDYVTFYCPRCKARFKLQKRGTHYFKRMQ